MGGTRPGRLQRRNAGAHPIREGLVSMTWSGVFRGGLKAPFDRWGRDGNAVSRGERSLPDGADPALPSLPMADAGREREAPTAGDATGAQRPLPRSPWYYHGHLAFVAIDPFVLSRRSCSGFADSSDMRTLRHRHRRCHVRQRRHFITRPMMMGHRLRLHGERFPQVHIGLETDQLSHDASRDNHWPSRLAHAG